MRRSGARAPGPVLAAVIVATVVVATTSACGSVSGAVPATTSATRTPAAGTTTRPTPTPTPTPRARSTPRAVLVDLAVEQAGVRPGYRTWRVRRGHVLRIVVSAYRELEIHLHGYDIEKVARPGHPAVIAVRPGDLGTFDLEAHDKRIPPLARIRVVG